MTAIQTLAKQIVAGDAPVLTDAGRTQLLGALLQGDLGGSDAWANAIWPVEKAFVEAYAAISNSCEGEGA